MVELTKDADKMICIIYKQYLNKIKSGMSKTASYQFKDNFYINDKDLSKWHYNDVNTALLELNRKGYIKLNIIGDFNITDQAIIYMENRFKNGFIELTDFIAKFI